MGRRKIEIKAIKDDRNRSVTFLKRKGGLFKKAHELSVLCSVDVAVIIFGSNKKLYEFSSGDINEIIGRHQYYGGAHEHKGPADFTGKREGDGSEEEEPDEAQLDEMRGPEPPPPHMLPHMPGYNMRPAPSASPPVPNGAMGYLPRQHTPQPAGSRPDSRNAGMIRRPGSNLGQHPPPQVPNGYTAYLQQQGPYQPPQPAPPTYPYSQAPPQPAPHAPMHPQYLDERRPSVPPPYRPPPEPHRQSTPQPQPPPPQIQPPQAPPQAQTPPQPEPRNDLLQVQQPQPKPMSVKSKSIFTPIDDNRSMLASQWGFSADKEITPIKPEKPPLPEHAKVPPYPQPQRTQSTASLGEKRPNLKLQIPTEEQGGGDGTTASPSAIQDSPKHAEAPKEPVTKVEGSSLSASGSSGVVLPPPSPSASALLSAGAQGPPNPFARPLPPSATGQNQQSYGANQNIETPMSALPSRFVADQFLPSPSSFYADWGFGGSGRSAGAEGSNMLPSPLNWQTPVGQQAPGFGSGEKPAESAEAGVKREREGGDDGEVKRVKA